MDKPYHIPVMPNEVLERLNIKPNGVYVDGTLGGGGHSRLILNRLGEFGRLIAIDKDLDALSNASELREFSQLTLVNDSFENIDSILDRLNIAEIDGALLDLGVSSHQIDSAERGFSYMQDAPLDMRMDKNQTISAFDVINNYSEQQLTDIFFGYGEERFSRRIAAAIVKQRVLAPIKTTNELNEIIRKNVRVTNDGHPSKRVFQAVRIEVNNELSGLKKCLERFVDRLKCGGRLAVITFHSLEDRIVKQLFRLLSTDCICDKTLPICVCGHKAQVKMVGKDITASKDELNRNNRAKSARLRVIEKIV